MSFVAAAVTSTLAIGGTLYQQSENRKAARDAREEQRIDEILAKKAKVFAETEGQGLGDVGEISLDVSDEINESSSVRI